MSDTSKTPPETNPPQRAWVVRYRVTLATGALGTGTVLHEGSLNIPARTQAEAEQVAFAALRGITEGAGYPPVTITLATHPRDWRDSVRRLIS